MAVDVAVALNPPSLGKCVELEHGMPCNRDTDLPDIGMYSVAFSPDGTLAVTAAGDGRIKLWKVTRTGLEPDGRVITTMTQGRVAFSPDGKLLAVGGFGGELFLYEIATGMKSLLPGHMERVRGVQFHGSGSRLVTVDSTGVLKVWDVVGKRAESSTALFQGVAEPWSLAIVKGGPPATIWAAVGLGKVGSMPADGGLTIPGDGAYVWFGNLANTAQFSLLKADTDSVDAVAISPDDRYLLAGGEDSEIGVWDVLTRERPSRIGMVAPALFDPRNTNRTPLTGLSFAGDGRHVAASYGGPFYNAGVRIITVPGWQVLNTLPGMANSYYWVSVAFRPQGDMVIAGQIVCGLVTVCTD
jgi:WD40 repeat protein